MIIPNKYAPKPKAHGPERSEAKPPRRGQLIARSRFLLVSCVLVSLCLVSVFSCQFSAFGFCPTTDNRQPATSSLRPVATRERTITSVAQANAEAERLIDGDDLEEARQLLLIAVDANPLYFQTLLNLAKVNHLLYNYDEALKFADRALETDPADLNARVTKAEIFFSLKRLDEAEVIALGILKETDDPLARQLVREISDDSAIVEQYYNTAQALIVRGDLSGARRVLTRALDLNALHEPSLHALETLTVAEQAERVKVIEKRAVAVSPQPSTVKSEDRRKAPLAAVLENITKRKTTDETAAPAGKAVPAAKSRSLRSHQLHIAKLSRLPDPVAGRRRLSDPDPAHKPRVSMTAAVEIQAFIAGSSKIDMKAAVDDLKTKSPKAQKLPREFLELMARYGVDRNVLKGRLANKSDQALRAESIRNELLGFAHNALPAKVREHTKHPIFKRDASWTSARLNKALHDLCEVSIGGGLDWMQTGALIVGYFPQEFDSGEAACEMVIAFTASLREALGLQSEVTTADEAILSSVLRPVAAGERPETSWSFFEMAERLFTEDYFISFEIVDWKTLRVIRLSPADASSFVNSKNTRQIIVRIQNKNLGKFRAPYNEGGSFSIAKYGNECYLTWLYPYLPGKGEGYGRAFIAMSLLLLYEQHKGNPVEFYIGDTNKEMAESLGKLPDHFQIRIKPLQGSNSRFSIRGIVPLLDRDRFRRWCELNEVNRRNSGISVPIDADRVFTRPQTAPMVADICLTQI